MDTILLKKTVIRHYKFLNKIWTQIQTPYNTANYVFVYNLLLLYSYLQIIVFIKTVRQVLYFVLFICFPSE